MIDDLMKHYGEHKDIFYDRLETFLRTARNEALEEAARTIDGMYKGLTHNRLYRDMANEMSPRIRALKHKEGQP